MLRLRRMATKKNNTNPDLSLETTPAAESTPAWPSAEPKRRRGSRATGILFLLLVGVSAYAYYLYQQNQDLQSPERQAARVVAAISRHIIVPTEETPGIFPVDKAKNTETFFKNAETGDLLVVYRSTNQALIWSPRRNILVNAGVLVVNPTQDTLPSTTASSSAKAEKAEKTETAATSSQ